MLEVDHSGLRICNGMNGSTTLDYKNRERFGPAHEAWLQELDCAELLC